MTRTETDVGTLIICSPDIRSDEPRIAGTGVTVKRIYGWYKLGLSAEEIADEFGHLRLAPVYAALAYYHANKEQIEATIASEDQQAVQLEDENSPGKALG